jgi:putative toxin-antitoxin system antitoxin component (TIGR02293 family)
MELLMTSAALAKSPPRPLSRVAVPKVVAVTPKHFWDLALNRASTDREVWRRALQTLVRRVIAASDVQLFEAVEQGVPTFVVDLIASATHEPTTRVMDMIGVAPTTFKRKDEAGESLPQSAGQRVMGLLRVMATLRRALEESGEPEQLSTFDQESWLAQWLKEPLAELKNKTPAEMLRNSDGQRALEQVIERMRGGLPA